MTNKLSGQFTESEFRKKFIDFTGNDLNFRNFVWSQDRTKKDTYYIISTCDPGIALLMVNWQVHPKGMSIIKYSDLKFYTVKQNMFTEEFGLTAKDGLQFRTDLNYILFGYDKQKDNVHKLYQELEKNGVQRAYHFGKA